MGSRFLVESEEEEEEELEPEPETPKKQTVIKISQPMEEGEKQQFRIQNVILEKFLQKQNEKPAEGVLYLTNYKLLFIPYPLFSNSKTVQESDWVVLPLTAILRFEKVDKQNGSSGFRKPASYAVDIMGKDFRQPIRLIFDPQNEKHPRDKICQYLQTFVYPSAIQLAFCIASRSSKQRSLDRKPFFEIPREYARMGVSTVYPPTATGHFWQLSPINKDFSLCATYPRWIVVPNQASMEILAGSASFRSRSRLPALSWRSSESGASLLRCSQPKIGMTYGVRSAADEELFRLIREANPSSRKLYIIDARPMTNALANMAVGGGYESLSNYPKCELEFRGLPNIHVVKESAQKLKDLIEEWTIGEHENPPHVPHKNMSTWFSQLESTRWLEWISSLLHSALRISQLLIEDRASVLVHCSDGWDRTPQIVSLSQILVDPFYRTIFGFLSLIEKEWLQFGHKFGDRLGLNFVDLSYSKDTERSPIFLQFFDAVYQILHQFPTSFEFTEELLIFIIEHSVSSRFGNFLMNSQKEREDADIWASTDCMWEYIMSQKSFVNTMFVPQTNSGVLNPKAHINYLKLWKSFYFKSISPDPINNKYLSVVKKAKEREENLVKIIQQLKQQINEKNPSSNNSDSSLLTKPRERSITESALQPKERPIVIEPLRGRSTSTNSAPKYESSFPPEFANPTARMNLETPEQLRRPRTHSKTIEHPPMLTQDLLLSSSSPSDHQIPFASSLDDWVRDDSHFK